MFIKTLLKLDLVQYSRECSSCKQCYNRALYKVSNLVSADFFGLIILPKKKKSWIKYLKVCQKRIEISPYCAMR